MPGADRPPTFDEVNEHNMHTDVQDEYLSIGPVALTSLSKHMRDQYEEAALTYASLK